MCKTTSPKKTPKPGLPDPPDAPAKPVPKPPILSLQRFLTEEFTSEKPNLEPSGLVVNGFTIKSKDAAISIVMTGSDGDHHAASINGAAMDFSGSLVKVAALYAAHDLRSTARKHAKDNSFSDQASFLSSLNSAIDTTGAVASLRAVTFGLKPNYNEIFVGFKPSAPNKVEFKPAPGFSASLAGIHDNPHAAIVIRALGYSYINVSLMAGGFFDPATSKGIWLAGDYSGGQATPTIRVPVDNDTVPGGSGQAITTEQMSRMFRLVHMGEAYPHVADAAERAAANNGMHAILQHEGSFFFSSNSTVQISVTPSFTNECAKVGIGPLGPLQAGGGSGLNTISEGSVMVWGNASEVTAFNTAKQRNLTGDFALVWQNMYPPNAHFDALVRVVNKSIQRFLTQP
jgi:hypothetical protein